MRIDVTGAAPYSAMAGATVEAFDLLSDQFGILGGVAITAGGSTIWLANVGDDCEVYTDLPADFRVTMRVASSSI